MRLGSHEVNAIGDCFREVFKEGEVYLFGSKVDDDLRGGDIDLCLAPKQKDHAGFDQKVSFLVALKQKIGDQKIDVVFEHTCPPLLAREIKHKGILICKI